MKTFSYILGSLLIAGLAFAAAAPQKGGEDETGPYEVRPQLAAGGLWGVHQVSVDSEGNLYLAEVFNGRVQKLRPKAGAERARLVAQTTHSLTR
jgi:hypothetical protein